MLRPAVIALAVLLVALAVPSEVRAVDTSPWARVLTAHAKADGFDYAGLREDEARMADLARFVADVGGMGDDEPLASWLNAYNALVVHAVATRPGLRSVRDVDGFFDTIRYRVAGRQRTLDDVENRVIRPRFRDARIHFALNCGARGCPLLHGRPFEARTLDATLDRLCRNAVASAQHVRMREGRLQVSEIFFWFRADFERDAGSVIAWLARFGGDRFASLPPDTPVGRITYDWRLNAAR